MATLGVNIDHVATVRQARRTIEPDPVWAAALAELGGADAITVHLREDRRHIQDRDLEVLRQTVQVKLNLESAVGQAMVQIACRVRPDQVTLVPENRAEITTEGGLDAAGQRAAVGEAVSHLRGAGIDVSLFIDPDPVQIEVAAALGVQAVELHTGCYANAAAAIDREQRLLELARAATLVGQAGLVLNAGHGLTYRNVVPVARLAGMHELNIGHSIVARAVLVGMTQAVREMKALIASCNKNVCPGGLPGAGSGPML
jgi:pyridoxine 5-phosphate synthase